MSEPKVFYAKFKPGKIVATPGFIEKCDQKYAAAALQRHLMCDWGLVCEHDWEANNRDVKRGGRLVSSYPLPNDPAKFWIITEGDRSYTTFLLPEEY